MAAWESCSVGVVGVSHIRLSTTDVGLAVDFYRSALGFELVAEWPLGADLVSGDVWLALVVGPHESRDDDPHIALHVDRHQFDDVASRVRASGAVTWQDNPADGDSLQFCDPDGHHLAIYSATISERIERALAEPWDGLALADDALRRVRPAPSLSDPRKPRRLACAPVGVFTVVVDAHDRVLFLRNPATQRLEVPNGAMETGEDPAETARRELSEEAGPVQVGPLRCCAAFNVEYHHHLPPVLSVGFVGRYLAGEPIAGDDMTGCDVVWLRLDDLDEAHLIVPSDRETLRRAIATLGAHE